MENRTRPAGVTVLAILLGLLALRGFARFSGPGDGLFLEGVLKHPLSSVLVIGYSLSALVAAVLLWEMKRGAVAAYAAWTLLPVSVVVIHDVSLKIDGKTDTEWWLIILPPVVLTLILVVVGVLLNAALKHQTMTT
jgi:hypothetical protein